MATYTVQGGQSWLGLSMQLYGDYEHAKYLRKLNRGTTLSQGVVIRTGGAVAGERAPDINPWGLSVGQVPASAYQTATGTSIALDYLNAIGQPAGGTTEAPGVTTVGEGFTSMEALARQTGLYTPGAQQTRPPAELAPQAQMVGPEQLPVAQPVEGFTSMEAAARQAGLYTPGTGFTGERETLEALAQVGEGITPTLPTIPPPPYEPPPRPDLPEGAMPGQYVMGEGAPGYQEGYGPSSAALGMGMWGGFASALGGIQVGGAQPTGGGEAVTPEAAEAEVDKRKRVGTTVMPAAVYPYGTTSAANYTARMMSSEYDVDGNLIREGTLAGAVSPDVADMLGMSNEMLVLAGYVWDTASGLWRLQPQGEGAGTTTTTGYGGGGGRRRGRRGYGGGQSPYGSSFKSNVGGLINWRRGFGG